jgi:MFS family permease
MLARIFRHSDIPPEYHSNFTHLYLDIGYFGVLSGSAVNFLNIYAARLGASGLQIGLIAAMSAVVNLFLASPAGSWIERRHTGRAVFWSSVFYRIGYALWIPLPWLFNAEGQIWALIILTFLMAIPLTPLGVGFNALFAEAVPEEHRAHVAGIRNATFAITFMITSFVSGFILKSISFPEGYQIVFAIGALGAAMSSLHLYFVKPLQIHPPASPPAPQPEPAAKIKPVSGILSALRLDIWSTPYRNVLLVFLGFHLAYYLPTPIYSLYNVHILALNDNQIGTGTALFYLTVLLGSTQLKRFVHRLGHKTVTGWGVVGSAFYPFALSLSHGVWGYYATSIIGGVLFALHSGTYVNYLLEKTPPAERPSHLAWYNIILNLSILGGSVGGPLIADQLGLGGALMLIALLRFLSGLALLKWG